MREVLSLVVLDLYNDDEYRIRSNMVSLAYDGA